MPISSHANIIHKSNDNQSHMFCFQVCQWSSTAAKAQFCDPKMTPKSTRAHPADSVPSPKLPKDTPAARSQHSGRVGGRSYARLKAEIALHNIPTATRHDTQPPIAHFQIFCRAATTCARIDPKSSPHRFAHSYSEVRGQSGTKINVDLSSRVHVNFTI